MLQSMKGWIYDILLKLKWISGFQRYTYLPEIKYFYKLKFSLWISKIFIN